MLKYLEDIIGRLRDIRLGVAKNMSHWSGNEILNELDLDISELSKLNEEILDLRTRYMDKLALARKLRDMKKAKIKVLEKRIIGLHAEEPDRLRDYYI